MMMEENELFNEIAMALASRYEAIYHVDIQTNEYTEYNARGEYKKTAVGNKGKDFFVDTKENMKKSIYSEDLSMMNQFMDKGYLLNNLSQSSPYIS